MHSLPLYCVFFSIKVCIFTCLCNHLEFPKSFLRLEKASAAHFMPASVVKFWMLDNYSSADRRPALKAADEAHTHTHCSSHELFLIRPKP